VAVVPDNHWQQPGHILGRSSPPPVVQKADPLRVLSQEPAAACVFPLHSPAAADCLPAAKVSAGKPLAPSQQECCPPSTPAASLPPDQDRLLDCSCSVRGWTGPNLTGPRWGRTRPENHGQPRLAAVSRLLRSAAIPKRFPRSSDHPDWLSHGGSRQPSRMPDPTGSRAYPMSSKF
jgi:hypothetical protein